MSERRTLWKILTQRRNERIGPIIGHESLLKLIIEGVDEKYHLETPRMECIKRMMKDQRCNLHLQLKLQSNRKIENIRRKKNPYLKYY